MKKLSEVNSSSSSGGSEAEGGGWLVSYADLMTLIACFFILMMAFANYDPVGFSQKVEEVSKHFRTGKFKPSKTKLKFIQEELINHPEILKKTKISLKDDTLYITFSSSVLFEPGSHFLNKKSIPILDSVIDVIKSQDPNFRILVEGHTDNSTDLQGSLTFKSNWALSGARAANIIERFEYFGFDPQKLVAIGLADTKPLLPNEDKDGKPLSENMKLNRRVVIKVLSPKDKTKQMKLGFGVYFKDATENSKKEKVDKDLDAFPDLDKEQK